MIDLRNGTEILSKYSGSEKKIAILLDGIEYMVKFPDPIREKSNALSYMNNQFSEHIGCRIFESCGLVAQETQMGIRQDRKGREKIVVACTDFEHSGAILYEFSNLANAIVELDKKIELTIENVNTVLDLSEMLTDKEGIKAHFWDMFVVDALIGNYDRHFDNWGFLKKGEEVTFAPIYDCGSALCALHDDEKMWELLNNSTAFKSEEYNARSCYSLGGKKIFYHEIFANPPYELTAATKRIVPKIELAKIDKIIFQTEFISETRKEYLKKAIRMRYEQILIPAMNRILKKER